MDDNYFFAVPVVVFEVIYGVPFNSTQSLIREEYLIIQMRFHSNDELFASVCREPLPNILHHSSQSFIIAQCCESIHSEMLYKAYTLVQSNHNLTTFSITQSYRSSLIVSGLLTDSVQLTFTSGLLQSSVTLCNHLVS